MRRIVLINLIVVVVILVAAGVGGYLLYNNYFFYSTDDAQVTGNIVNIVSTVSGTLNSLTIKIGDYVDESAIKNVSVGQFVDVHVDAYSGTSFKGHVSQIVGAAASQFSLLPTQDNSSSNFTKVGQCIPVIIALDSDSGQALLPGMSAEVVIHLH